MEGYSSYTGSNGYPNNQSSGNVFALNQKMSFYNYHENNSTLQINQPINNLTINGSKNKIIFKAMVANLIVNGDKNDLNVEHRNGMLSNVIINGGNNKIVCTRRTSNFNKIDNGRNNSCVVVSGNNNSNAGTSGSGNNRNSYGQSQTHNSYTQNNGGGTNYSIRIDNNGGGFDSNIFEFINNVTGNLGVNIQLGNFSNSRSNPVRIVTRNNNCHYTVDSDFDISSSDNSIVYFDEDDEGEDNNIEDENDIDVDADTDVHNNLYQNHNHIHNQNYNMTGSNLGLVEDNIDDEEDLREEAYRELLLQKRAEKIDDFNIFQFKHWNKFVKRCDDTCSICLEKFKNIDICKQFSCSEHFFHKTCLESWLETSNYCPLCKYDLMEDVTIEEGEGA